MLRSRLNFLYTGLLCVFILFLIIHVFKNPIVLEQILGLLVVSFIMIYFSNSTKTILVTEDYIIIKNWLTRSERKYLLSEFHLKLENQNLTAGKIIPHRILLLIKDGIIIIKIEEMVYSNYENIFWALRKVPTFRSPHVGLLKRLLLSIGIKPKL